MPADDFGASSNVFRGSSPVISTANLPRFGQAVS